MRIKKNYIAIFAITILAAATGSYFTSQGMDWYDGLNLPELAPDGRLIGTVWTIIYTLSALSVILFWNSPRKENFLAITILFVVNAALNVLWSFLFFTLHLIWWAFLEMILLNLVNLALILLLWRYNKKSALLLIPYFIWVSFASYLTYLIGLLN